jgi:hypothetical protein
VFFVCYRSKRWETLTVDVSQGSSHESLGGQPSSGIAPLGSAMSLSASAASLAKDPSKGPPGGFLTPLSCLARPKVAGLAFTLMCTR